MINLDYLSYNNKSGIYKIYSTNKIYIGSAKNLFQRISSHLSDLKNNKHSNKYLQNVFNKHGESYLSVDVIELTDNLIEREQYWIDILNCVIPNGYNICPIAKSRRGVKQNPESVEKTAKKNRGRKLSEETKLKMSKSNRRLSPTKEHIEKLRKITSERLKNKPSKRKSIVIQFSINGEFIKEWESITLASNTLKIAASHISSCCKSKKNSIGGFKWKYK